MNITYINPTYLMRRPISELAEKLSKKNKITIFIPRKIFKPIDNSLHHSKLPKKIKIIDYPTISLPIIYEWPIPISPNIFYKLYTIFKNSDIIHMWTYSYIINLMILVYSNFFKNNLILTFDTVPGKSFSLGPTLDKFYKVYHNLFSNLIFKTPKAITVYGKSIAKYARQVGAKNTIIIPTATNISSKPKTKSIRKEFKISRNKKIILFVGLISTRKGIDRIIDAINKNRSENIIALLVGSGPEYPKFKDMVKKLNLEDKIIFAGSRKDIQNFYSDADIFLFPSRGEGMPGAIMEAMTFNLPIITSKIPGTIDLVDNNSAILTKNYASNLKKLIKSKSLRQKLGKSAKNQSKNYNWKDVSNKYMKLYSKILQ